NLPSVNECQHLINGDSTEKHERAIAHDHPQYRSGLSAERHPNPDLTCASRDRIGFNSVEANYGQTKRKSAKDGEQRGARANQPEVEVRIKVLGERSQGEDRE